MSLLTAGYWQTTYWTQDYWADDYWLIYGAVAPATGILTISVTSSQPGATFTSKQPGVAFTSKRPGATFSES